MKTLVHCIAWENVADTDYTPVLEMFAAENVHDIVANPAWALRDPEWFEALYRKLADCGFRTPACHGLWGKEYDLSCASGNGMAAHKEFLERFAGRGVRTYAIHPGGRYSAPGGNRTEWENIRRNIEALLPVAEKCNIILAFENSIYELSRDLEMVRSVLDEFHHPLFRICFDTGHAHAGPGFAESFRYLEPDVVTCHLHDNYGTGDNHNPPGDGNIDWKILVSELKSCPALLHAETESSDWSIEVWRKFKAVWEQE